MTATDQIRNGIIEKLLTISNKDYLTALFQLVKGSPTDKDNVKLTSEQIKVIQSNPKLFIKADFQDTHISALGHFSIFYKFTKYFLIITAFWDNRQNPKKLFNILKKTNCTCHQLAQTR
jgi:hypothetical protein